MFNLNLGVPKLLNEWKGFFTGRDLFADITAGLTVACIAIPLSLAIALASGVPPGVGLITAIVAGIVCALFGGTRLSVSGPAAAMSVLIASNVEKFGLSGLILMGLLVGIFQAVSGIFQLGRLARFVPLPVIAGFTAGIGAIILIDQLPRAFGLLPPPQSHIFDVFSHIHTYFANINLAATVLVVVTFIITRGLPKLFPKIPASLIAVILATLLVYYFPILTVPLIGKIPSSLPWPHLPSYPKIPLGDVLLNAIAIYLLASLETLLSSSAVDKLTKGPKHDPNQELIGQGFGNIAVSLFGGIPISGVIVRSALNVTAGAKTRRASIIHSLAILAAVLFAAKYISLIPVAALAGILFSVAFSMLNYHGFIDLWKHSRSEAFVYAVTFVTIIFFDLIAGIQIGIIASALILLWQTTKTQFHVSSSVHDGIVRLSLIGNLTFLSSNKITKIEDYLKSITAGQTVILDLSTIDSLDGTGASAIIEIFYECKNRGINFYIKGLPKRFEALFDIHGGHEILKEHYLMMESELLRKDENPLLKSFRGRLVHGVQKFYVSRRHQDKRLFEHIKTTQNPHTLFITCSDSRIIPSLITSSDPGELFIVRNIGNYVPKFDFHKISSEAAAVEFAIENLNISDIVVCGHSSCGAMNACCHDTHQLPQQLKAWIEMLKTQAAFSEQIKHKNLKQLAQINVLNQIQHLKTYPAVQQKLKENNLHLHAWYYDFEENYIYEWNEQMQTFEPIPEQTAETSIV